eukprot:11179150-Prorocentrum_lima.AAC.1
MHCRGFRLDTARTFLRWACSRTLRFCIEHRDDALRTDLARAEQNLECNLNTFFARYTDQSPAENPPVNPGRR